MVLSPLIAANTTLILFLVLALRNAFIAFLAAFIFLVILAANIPLIKTRKYIPKISKLGISPFLLAVLLIVAYAI